MALVKLYGKILAYILAAIIAVSTTVISSRALKVLNDKDAWKQKMEERVNCIEKSQLTRDDVRMLLNEFKLDLIEENMIIVPDRRKK